MGFGGDDLLACRSRGCSSGGREQVERQEKRELLFEKKPPHGCGGMPGVRAIPRLSPSPACPPCRHPSPGCAGRLGPARPRGQQIRRAGTDPAGVSPTSCRFCCCKRTKPFCGNSSASTLTQGAQPPCPWEVPMAGSGATSCPQCHRAAPLWWNEPLVGLHEILACCVPPVPAMHIL